MTNRERLIALLARGPAKFPEIVVGMGLTRPRTCMVLATAMKAGKITRTGERRQYLYALPAKSDGAALQAVWR